MCIQFQCVIVLNLLKSGIVLFVCLCLCSWIEDSKQQRYQYIGLKQFLSKSQKDTVQIQVSLFQNLYRKMNQNSQYNFEKEKQIGRNQSTQFQDVLNSYTNQDCMVLVAGQTHGSTEQNRELQNQPTQVYPTSFLTKLQKQFNREMIAFSTNSARAIRHQRQNY